MHEKKTLKETVNLDQDISPDLPSLADSSLRKFFRFLDIGLSSIS